LLYLHRLLLEHRAVLTEMLNLELTHSDKEKELVQFKLPSREILEVFGTKSLWHCFTTTPEWELIIADVQHRQKKRTPEAEGSP
jgi:hypothetical protein